ncbi:translation initiation factor IF-2 isoform X2 [Syngnathus acus]|uniref:translation initiation factor IF-2 isoform X2 n=1 Tax=Syngnathus acus TaxID=161584 RepID=UPI001885C933|nr:translation initiation factor IF-2 isoform X2 [Syngnathus acus]
MGCSTSSQTSAVDSTKPGIKPKESNGTNTTVTANGNADSRTVPDQMPADSSDVKPTDDTATATAQEEELQLMDAEADAAPSEPPAEAPPENASAQAEATDSTEPKQETTETPASSD